VQATLPRRVDGVVVLVPGDAHASPGLDVKKSVTTCSGVQVVTDFSLRVSETMLGGSWPPTHSSL